MSTMLSVTGPVEIEFGSLLKLMSDDEFFDLCQRNRDLRIERTKEGDIIIMPPAGTKSGKRNFDLTVSFGIWAKQDGTGNGFDSSTGFTLPNGAQLGWLIDPAERKVYIYRQGAAVEILDDPQAVSGEPTLQGFALDVRSLRD